MKAKLAPIPLQTVRTFHFVLFCYWSLFLPYLFNFSVTTVKTNTYTQTHSSSHSHLSNRISAEPYEGSVCYTHSETPKEKQKQNKPAAIDTQLNFWHLRVEGQQQTESKNLNKTKQKQLEQPPILSFRDENDATSSVLSNIYIYCKQNSKQTKQTLNANSGAATRARERGRARSYLYTQICSTAKPIDYLQ